MNTTGYPLDIVLGKKTKTLIWIDSDTKNHILTKSNGDVIILVDDKELSNEESFGLQINWEERGKTDLNKFYATVKNLKCHVISSPKTREILLEGWNLIQDLSTSLNITESEEIFRDSIILKFYNKLFYGNNLPAITPDGKCYDPIWTSEELDRFKPAMLRIKEMIREKAPYLFN